MQFLFSENRLARKNPSKPDPDELSDWYQSEGMETSLNANHPQNVIIQLLREEQLEEAYTELERIERKLEGDIVSFQNSSPPKSPPQRRAHEIRVEKKSQITPIRRLIGETLRTKRNGERIRDTQRRTHDKIARAIQRNQSTEEHLRRNDELLVEQLEQNDSNYREKLAKCIAMMAALDPSALEPVNFSKEDLKEHRRFFAA